jgi:hypothetical protein
MFATHPFHKILQALFETCCTHLRREVYPQGGSRFTIHPSAIKHGGEIPWMSSAHGEIPWISMVAEEF